MFYMYSGINLKVENIKKVSDLWLKRQQYGVLLLPNSPMDLYLDSTDLDR